MPPLKMARKLGTAIEDGEIAAYVEGAARATGETHLAFTIGEICQIIQK